jgi:hypothetical protein
VLLTYTILVTIVVVLLNVSFFVTVHVTVHGVIYQTLLVPKVIAEKSWEGMARFVRRHVYHCKLHIFTLRTFPASLQTYFYSFSFVFILVLRSALYLLRINVIVHQC